MLYGCNGGETVCIRSGFDRRLLLHWQADAAAQAYGKEPVIYDIMTGAGPGAIFLKYLGAPIASPTGTLRPDGNMHGYNEHGALDDYLTHVNFTLTLLRELEAHGFGDHAD